MATDPGEQPRPWWQGYDGEAEPPAQAPDVAGDGGNSYSWPQQGLSDDDPSQPWRGAAGWYGQSGYGLPARRRPGRALAVVAGVGGLLATAVAGGFAVHALTAADRSATASFAPATPPSAGSAPSSGSGSGGGTGLSPGGGSSPGGSGSPDPGGSGPSDVAEIAAKVDPGLADINTIVGDGQARAAGTGMILTADGTVLTNNHVIEGATSISVTDVGNGQTYQAAVIGYSVTSDVAVLQIAGASGLQTITTASAAPSVGEQVVGIGNAGGAGGTPSYAGGTITATGQSITASDDLTGSEEQLTGMIETNADIQPGDSGGSLVDDSGQVIGMDTAGSQSFQFSSGAQGNGFAIPIATATSLAGEIVGGLSSASVHVGPTAFLGIQVGGSGPGGFGRGAGGAPGGGVPVAGVVAGGPAAGAGLTSGDVITSVGGYAVTSQSALQEVMTADLSPGQAVTVQFTDSAGQQQSVILTLVSGPPA